MNQPVFLDFETEAIGPRPDAYPPRPVGLAVLAGDTPIYMAWGHPTGNNCTYEQARDYLGNLIDSGAPVCFHNAAFDCSVLSEGMGLPWPTNLNDTLISCFLKDPYAPSLALKRLAKDWCGIDNDEQAELHGWILENVPDATPKNSGAYISSAPADIVGKYAKSDVLMTRALYEKCSHVFETMGTAYRREIDILRILNHHSKTGIRVDVHGLSISAERAMNDLQRLTAWLNNYFAPAEINFNSGRQLFNVLEARGIVTREGWPLSPSGQPRTDKTTMEHHVPDKDLVAVLRYRDLLNKLLNTYIMPWLEVSESTGRLYTDWNSVRNEFSGGVRTGRLSCKPTLQTIPHRLPRCSLPAELADVEVPHLRDFWLPDEGHKLVAADFSGQELRLFAHFEGGKLAERYRQDPNADQHQFASDEMTKHAGKPIIRDVAKGIVFGILYGMGPGKLSGMLNIQYDEARELIDVYKKAVATGLPRMNQDMQQRYLAGKPIRTAGGRLIKGEPPKVVNGFMRRFDYKMVNLLIQATAADQAKQAMLDYDKASHRDARLWLSMYDELVISAPEEIAEAEGKKLTESMVNAFQLDVPFVADFKVGDTYSDVK